MEAWQGEAWLLLLPPSALRQNKRVPVSAVGVLVPAGGAAEASEQVVKELGLRNRFGPASTEGSPSPPRHTWTSQ